MVNPPVNWPTASRRRWRWASGPKTHRQTIGNDGTQSFGGCGIEGRFARALWSYASPTATEQTTGNCGTAKLWGLMLPHNAKQS